MAQLQAMLENAKLTTDRARTLLGGPAGQQSTYDAAFANQRSLEAQVQAAQAQVQSSEISLGYTDIRSPIDGKTGLTAVTEGNVVSPSSGVLTTIVSQDPMYVLFPIPVREALDLRDRYAPRGGFGAVVMKLRLPDGRLYDQAGRLNFVNNTITQGTDTITLRGVVPNPVLREPTITNAHCTNLPMANLSPYFSKAYSLSNTWSFRARPSCLISKATTFSRSAPTIRPSSAESNLGNRRRPSLR